MSYDQEYFCPHCGAILNNQPGFDPDCGTWTCTECGQMLMDDDVYNGDTYEGVAWFCDNCGALLNRQDGFSDSYGSWKCTECGHINGTTDQDIINGYKCPKCGATLDVQSCFSEYDETWECTECGALLYREYDEYTEVKHKCPNCGAVLDKQCCFVDFQNNWTCTECGAHLHHDYSDDEYSVIKYFCPKCDAPLDIQWGFSEFDDDWKCTECGAQLHHDYGDEYEEVEEAEDNEANDVPFRAEQKASSKRPSSVNSNSSTSIDALDGLTQKEFEKICKEAAKKFRQIVRVNVEGSRVTCLVRPRIGRSWIFYLELLPDNKSVWDQQYKRNSIPEQYVALVLNKVEQLRKERTKNRRKATCPNCRGTIIQNAKNDKWACPSCGYELPPNAFEKDSKFVFRYCGKCSSYLNVQPGFSDNLQLFKCIKCGYTNSFSTVNAARENKNSGVIVNYCPYCGTFVKSSKGKYCYQCGKKL